MTNLTTTNENCPDQTSQDYFICITFFACLFNITLFVLIYTSTHNLMKQYLKILYSGVCIDFVSAILQFSTQVRPSMQGELQMLTISMDGFLPLLVQDWRIFQGAHFTYILVPHYFACYSVIIYSLVPFIYRYLLVCWDYQTGLTSFGLLMFIILGIALYAAVAINYVCFLVYDKNINHVPIPNPNCTRYLPQIKLSLDLTDAHIIFVYKTWYYTALFFECSYVIILFCAIRVFLFFRRKAQLISTQNRRIQLQVFLTIMSQTVIPLVAYYAQFIAKLFTDIFGLSDFFTDDLFYKTMFISYTVIPVLNPLAAIFIISSYRRVLISFLLRPLKGIRVEPHVELNQLESSEGSRPRTPI